jgi:ESS family glutamate:Na+ symporter
MGGPIARFLIRRHNLKPSHDRDPPSETTADTPEKQEPMSYFSLLRTFFWLNMSLVVGEGIFYGLKSLGRNLPLFVCCLFGAILLTNIVPRLVRIRWPARTRSLAVVSDISLGVFLTMSLMSLQLWTIAGLAGPILAILAAQFVVSIGFTLFVVFRAMGSHYNAAVISAGFAGFSLGATPTAMANMSAVANKYGPAPQAFIIVPLVSGFFVDISNSLIIQRFIGFLT